MEERSLRTSPPSGLLSRRCGASSKPLCRRGGGRAASAPLPLPSIRPPHSSQLTHPAVPAAQENVAERGFLSRAVQRLTGPWWASLLGYRFQDTEALIRRVFEGEAQNKGRFKVDVERFRATGLPLMRRFLAPHVRGVVTKLQ